MVGDGKQVSTKRGNKTSNRYYANTFYDLASEPINPPRCIPIKYYSEKYHVSRSQILLRVKRGDLCAVSVKRKIFIEDVPPLDMLSCKHPKEKGTEVNQYPLG